MQHKQWSGKTGGLPWMQRGLVGILRVVNIRIIYGIVALVVPFYMLFSRKGYKAIYRLFRNRFGYSRLKSFANVYMNHYRFGQIIMDRFYVYAGREFEFSSEGQTLFDDLGLLEGGFAQLSSHVGNYELAGYSLFSEKKKFNALVYAGETETVMKNREKLFSEHDVVMISVSEDFSHVFALNAALDNGEIVSMPADRIFGSSKSVECQFFGETARFPLGPFALITSKNVPALSIFVMKDNVRRYNIIFRELKYDPTADKSVQIAQLAQCFASDLEAIVRRYPTQWFNYFDFWKQ